ncbi:MAG: hypothetical protein RR847_02600 [Bacilli bacterium]
MIRIIQSNAHKYSITAMSKFLNIPCSSYYAYQEQQEIPDL